MPTAFLYDELQITMCQLGINLVLERETKIYHVIIQLIQFLNND